MSNKLLPYHTIQFANVTSKLKNDSNLQLFAVIYMSHLHMTNICKCHGKFQRSIICSHNLKCDCNFQQLAVLIRTVTATFNELQSQF